jgi:hypothetical protein
MINITLHNFSQTSVTQGTNHSYLWSPTLGLPT